jgi:DNA sulfur modification protein DndB
MAIQTRPARQPAKEARRARVSAFEYVFPAIRGIQAEREFYVTMCPLKLIPRLFVFDGEQLPAELRAQRTLNRARVPEIARYVTDNPRGYVFSALTASVDADLSFEPLAEGGPEARIGLLSIPMTARFVINDGQHRRAGIEQALRRNPILGDENIAVVFFVDVGLARCQQMFADLNRYAIRPQSSLSVLYDHREELAQIVRCIVAESSLFQGLVETEKSHLALRSAKLFTLSALYTATRALLEGFSDLPKETRIKLASSYWAMVAEQFPEWAEVQAGAMSAGELRRDFVHGHGIVLHALGRAGNTLLHQGLDPSDWPRRLRRLGNLNWSRSNASVWEGRAMAGGRMCKSSAHVVLTSNAVRAVLGLPLSGDERQAEAALSRGGT